MALLAASLALSAVAAARAAPFTSPFDSSYVVQLYDRRDDFVPPPAAGPLPSELMTTAAGHTFECFLPSLALVDADTSEPLDRTNENDVNGQEQQETAQEADALLALNRAAVREMQSLCVEYTDKQTSWRYEICVNALIIRFRKAPVEVQVDAAGAGAAADVGARRRESEFEEVGMFVADSRRAAGRFDEFADPETQKRVTGDGQSLFTQTYDKSGQEVQVQFVCGASARDDVVAAVQWREKLATNGEREVAAFLVESRAFCDLQESKVDKDGLATVQAVLQPLQDADTCVTRDEGWWTYEYCFGRSVRQYHRDEDGQVTLDFLLGVFDAEGNRELERLDSALVLEPIDETHDVPRPAFVELYNFGTLCKTSENQKPRKAKVFHYCSHDDTVERLIMTREVQTCVYTVKVSSPVLCDHPHFLNDERESDQTFEIVHCIPAVDAVVEAVEASEAVAA
ncbi:unnamed protein product [Hyaloperonospora brassicae]|uniref:MRH domain-containing protein n=1 Tax=Hyaloperonospora brassicae TaxID=162125 RepID=A0AAV0UEE2_HYABA|nr:unnamed protein product [Hyaloperonospora brassicae]